MRIGYAGKGAAAVAPGVTVGTVTVPADMVAGDVLLETAGLRYLYDTTALAPSYELSARSMAAGQAGQRFGGSLPMLANGTNYDPQTNKWPQTALASGADTTGGRSSGDLTSYNGRGLALLLSVSAVAGTGAITAVAVRAKYPSGNYRDFAVFTVTINSVVDRGYLIALGASDAASWDGKLATVVPRIYQVHTVASTDNAGNNITYQIQVVDLP